VENELQPDVALAMRALADRTRWAIVGQLAQNGELAVSDLLSGLDIAQSTLSHHVRLLAEAGLVSVRRDGRRRLLSLSPERLGGIAALLDSTCRTDGRESSRRSA
jgi:ArsR family transcriptional regulator